MSTRDQILAALAKAPEGLTLEQLVGRCPAAEGDRQILGAALAQLVLDNVLRRSGMRDGFTVYQCVNGAAVQTSPLARPAAEAAPAPHRPTHADHHDDDADPVTVPAVIHSAGGSTVTLNERIVGAIKNHLTQTTAELRKLAGGDDARLRPALDELVEAGQIVRLGRGRGTHYGLPKGNGAEPPKAARKTPPRGQRSAPAGAPVSGSPTSQQARMPAGAPPRFDDDGLAIAITDTGTLALSRDGQRIDLAPTDFARVRHFIQLTEQVWQGDRP